MGNELIKNIKYLMDCVLKVIYSSDGKCVICGKDIDEGLICSKCNGKFKKCNKKNQFKYEEYEINLYSSLYYSGVTKELIARLKYKSDFKAGEALVKHMIDTIKSHNIEFDLITYVPASKKRMKERGYNQSEYLAKAVGNIMNTKVLRILDKTKETKDQIGLKEKERWANLKDCFKCTNDKIIKGKKVLLVDDVITTGATSFYCSKIIISNGASEVSILTAAKSKI